jgi:hypothetical protein
VVEPDKHTNRDEHFKEMLRLKYDIQSEVDDFESKHDPVNIVDDIKRVIACHSTVHHHLRRALSLKP